MVEKHTQKLKGTNISFNMIAIESGTFKMGSKDGYVDFGETDIHDVKLSKYYIGEYLVT